MERLSRAKRRSCTSHVAFLNPDHLVAESGQVNNSRKMLEAYTPLKVFLTSTPAMNALCCFSQIYQANAHDRTARCIPQIRD